MVTSATAATSPTCSRPCWKGTTQLQPRSTPAVRRTCSMQWERFAPLTTSHVSSRWSPRWPVDMAPASVAQYRGATAATSVSASMGRWYAVVEFCGIELANRVINASGTFDAIAARHVYGEALLADFPFSAFVSKTITLEPRAGNE